MKRLALIPVMLLSLALAGCGPGSKVGDFIATATSTIVNPVSPNNIYQVKLTFNIAVKGANKWASYCWSKPWRALQADVIAAQVCKNHRETRRVLSASADKANAAIKSATTFIRNNPTINPLAAIDDAWRAVVDYKNLVAQVAP